MTKKILLTGITGFLAKRIAFDLLQAGYQVRGSLRDMSRCDEVRQAMADAPLDLLEFTPLDLQKDDGWAAGMDGVDVLMHTASPFPLAQPKDAETLIRPAVDGTLRALNAAKNAGVKRVILTSSMTAVMECERPDSHKFGPADWTDPAFPTANPYSQSKMMAERAAWEFVAAHPEIDMTVIAPGAIFGTPMDKHYGASLSIIERLLGGKDPAVPNTGFPIVDVQDVSQMHCRAVEDDSSIGERVIGTGHFVMLPVLADALAAAFPNRRVPTRRAPKWLLWLLSFRDPVIARILPELNRDLEVDPTSGRELLGQSFIDPKTSVLSSAKYISKTMT